MPGARWFTGARVNFAAHLLARGNGDQIALYAASESGPLRRWSWHALREDVFALATALREHGRSEEHTSELQSLMRISYAVFCLKKKKTNLKQTKTHYSISENI